MFPAILDLFTAPAISAMPHHGPGRRTIVSIMGPQIRHAFWNSNAQGTYHNPNRRLPRKQMLAARRAEQLARGQA